MHVVANLDAVATESHFFRLTTSSVSALSTPVSFGEKEVRTKVEKKISLITWLPTFWTWTVPRSFLASPENVDDPVRICRPPIQPLKHQ